MNKSRMPLAATTPAAPEITQADYNVKSAKSKGEIHRTPGKYCRQPANLPEAIKTAPWAAIRTMAIATVQDFLQAPQLTEDVKYSLGVLSFCKDESLLFNKAQTTCKKTLKLPVPKIPSYHLKKKVPNQRGTE